MNKRENELAIFQSPNDGKWYWHILAANGQIVAVGGEGYYSKSNAKRGFKSFWQTRLKVPTRGNK